MGPGYSQFETYSIWLNSVAAHTTAGARACSGAETQSSSSNTSKVTQSKNFVLLSILMHHNLTHSCLRLTVSDGIHTSSAVHMLQCTAFLKRMAAHP